MLRTADSFRFPETFNYVFTVDVKSIFVHCYPQRRWPLGIDVFSQQKTGPATTNPYSDSSCRTVPCIQHILVQWKFLSANRRGRDGKPFGTKLFVSVHGAYRGKIFDQYTGTKPALCKRYTDDIAGATPGSREEVEDFATYVNGFHPSLNCTWVISDVQLPFLDLCWKPIERLSLT